MSVLYPIRRVFAVVILNKDVSLLLASRSRRRALEVGLAEDLGALRVAAGTAYKFRFLTLGRMVLALVLQTRLQEDLCAV